MTRKESIMPSWIGPWEIAILVIILLVVFGPKRLPELGSSLGRAITGFRKGLKESEQELRKAVAEDGEETSAAKPAEAAAQPVQAAAQPAEAAPEPVVAAAKPSETAGTSDDTTA
jgi:sec-independent protein translocase protein TatA